MRNEELMDEMQKAMPEPPYGFDTRVDAQVQSLVQGKTKRAFRWGRRSVLALVMVLVLGISGVVGYAVNTAIAPSGTIAARLDKNANLTENVWYTNNTVGLAGLPLRDTYAGLTDKWYNVVPVDLTKHGRQTYTLVASNMYYIGECYVDVSADTVTVTYATYRGNLKKISECVRWFLDPAEITSAFLENPTSDMSFGQSLSIKDDLNGAEVALLFVCNQVTYRNPYDNNGSSLVRYYQNLDEWKAFRATLKPMLTQLDEQVVRMQREAEEKARQEAEAARLAEEEAARAAEEAAQATQQTSAE